MLQNCPWLPMKTTFLWKLEDKSGFISPCQYGLKPVVMALLVLQVSGLLVIYGFLPALLVLYGLLPALLVLCGLLPALLVLCGLLSVLLVL